MRLLWFLIYNSQYTTQRTGIIQTRIDKEIVITADESIDHDQVKICRI